jgi:phospholipase/carboxylesterase
MQLKNTSLETKFVASASGRRDHLLLLVHGRGGNLRVLEFYTRRFSLPDLNFLMIQGPFPEQREDQKERGEPGGWSWYYNRGEQIEKSRIQIQMLATDLVQEGFSLKQVYWLGFSQGAIMGLDTFLRANETWGGGLFVSGLCIHAQDYPEALGSAARKQQILITHGTRDEILPLELVEPTYQVLRDLQIPFEYKVFDKPHSFHMREEVPLLEERLQRWMSQPL